MPRNTRKNAQKQSESLSDNQLDKLKIQDSELEKLEQEIKEAKTNTEALGSEIIKLWTLSGLSLFVSGLMTYASVECKEDGLHVRDEKIATVLPVALMFFLYYAGHSVSIRIPPLEKEYDKQLKRYDGLRKDKLDLEQKGKSTKSGKNVQPKADELAEREANLKKQEAELKKQEANLKKKEAELLKQKAEVDKMKGGSIRPVPVRNGQDTPPATPTTDIDASAAIEQAAQLRLAKAAAAAAQKAEKERADKEAEEARKLAEKRAIKAKEAREARAQQRKDKLNKKHDEQKAAVKARHEEIAKRQQRAEEKRRMQAEKNRVEALRRKQAEELAVKEAQAEKAKAEAEQKRQAEEAEKAEKAEAAKKAAIQEAAAKAAADALAKKQAAKRAREEAKAKRIEAEKIKTNVRPDETALKSQKDLVEKLKLPIEAVKKYMIDSGLQFDRNIKKNTLKGSYVYGPIFGREANDIDIAMIYENLAVAVAIAVADYGAKARFKRTDNQAMFNHTAEPKTQWECIDPEQARAIAEDFAASGEPEPVLAMFLKDQEVDLWFDRQISLTDPQPDLKELCSLHARIKNPQGSQYPQYDFTVRDSRKQQPDEKEWVTGFDSIMVSMGLYPQIDVCQDIKTRMKEILHFVSKTALPETLESYTRAFIELVLEGTIVTNERNPFTKKLQDYKDKEIIPHDADFELLESLKFDDRFMDQLAQRVKQNSIDDYRTKRGLSHEQAAASRC